MNSDEMLDARSAVEFLDQEEKDFRRNSVIFLGISAVAVAAEINQPELPYAVAGGAVLATSMMFAAYNGLKSAAASRQAAAYRSALILHDINTPEGPAPQIETPPVAKQRRLMQPPLSPRNRRSANRR